MTAEKPSTPFFKKLERVVSRPRLDSYRTHGETDVQALSKYLWNTALCESLYPLFQILEVGFRNAIHLEVGLLLKDPNWLSNNPAFLYKDEIQAINDAKAAVAERRVTITEPYLVAEMSFGFWTSLLDARYDTMWHKIIANVFPHMPRTIRTRKTASKHMNTVRKLRNAALHHHSIWHWQDLPEQHLQMLQLIGWICDTLAAMAEQTDRFPTLYKSGHKAFGPTAVKISLASSPQTAGNSPLASPPHSTSESPPNPSPVAASKI